MSRDSHVPDQPRPSATPEAGGPPDRPATDAPVRGSIAPAHGTHRPGLDATHWRGRLAELGERHRVPGAVLGILRVAEGRPDEGLKVATGILSLRTGVAATSDALFQIGSITKVWTATLVMSLVDAGLLDLDAPVVEVLPGLQLSDPEVTRRITVRHLLTHTGGIDGDVFTDTGRGDDCLERYVALLSDVAQNHPLGATWSYCNSGYSLLGRIIEQVTDSTWDRALRERLFAPLGLEHTVTLPEEALLFATAVGHIDEEGRQRVAPVWCLPRSVGPAGLVTSTAADVLAFARMHLCGGLAADGNRVLSARSVAAMASHQADLPDPYVLGDSWGLGWIRFGWGGHRLVGHDGNTIGQTAFLRLLPEQGLAVTLLTNGGQARDLYEDLFREVFSELAGVSMPHPLEPPTEPVAVDPSPYVGTYERASVRMEVLAADADHAQARLRTTVTGTLAELSPEPPQEYAMVPVGPDLFVVRPPESENWMPVTFYALPTGERYMHFGARATRRTD
jgi:CubicO group peptidase (beta-lactamase class C family)